MQILRSNDHFLRENFLLRFTLSTLCTIRYAIQVKGKFAENIDDFSTLFDTIFYIIQQK